MIIINREPIQDNETQKLLWDYVIHMDNPIWARQPDPEIVKKKKKKWKENNGE